MMTTLLMLFDGTIRVVMPNCASLGAVFHVM